MKQDFATMLFMYEMWATLDGPDGQAKGWEVDTKETPWKLRRQQGGVGVMIWAAIINDEIVGPLKVDDEVKITSYSYTTFLEKILVHG